MKAARWLTPLILMLCVTQFFFWYGVPHTRWHGSRVIKPDLSIVEAPPGAAMVKLYAAGDDELLFRWLALGVESAGDSFGRNTPLKDYDYAMLYDWWLLLDGLDFPSDVAPNMASYYFSATQTPKKHIPYVVRYLEQHAVRDVNSKWWWLGQAVFQARYTLEDSDWALRIANHALEISPDVNAPLWIRQLPVFVLEKQGEYKAACKIMLDILDNYKNIPEGELNFMVTFIKDRVAAMKERGDWANDPDLDPRCLALRDIEPEKK